MFQLLREPNANRALLLYQFVIVKQTHLQRLCSVRNHLSLSNIFTAIKGPAMILRKSIFTAIRGPTMILRKSI